MNKYTELITSYNKQPKFSKTIENLTGNLLDISEVQDKYPYFFDLDNAIGRQLDILGEWIGRSRRLKTEITNIYFGFDTVDLGFDTGAWLGPSGTDTGYIELSDEFYRIALKLKISINIWDGGNITAQQILDGVVNKGTLKLYLVDNMDMSIDMLVSYSDPLGLPLELKEAIKQGYFDIKTAGVRLRYIFTGNTFFGFDNQTNLTNGFDLAEWGVNINEQ